MGTQDGSRRRTVNWPAFASATWFIAFSIPSFYWAAGGRRALGTIAKDPRQLLGRAATPGVLAATGVLKVIGGAFALSFARPRPLAPGPFRRWVARGLAVLIGIYGLAGFLDHVAMIAGARKVPEALGRPAAMWHAFLWDPFWVAGGILMGLASGPAGRFGEGCRHAYQAQTRL